MQNLTWHKIYNREDVDTFNVNLFLKISFPSLMKGKDSKYLLTRGSRIFQFFVRIHIGVRQCDMDGDMIRINVSNVVLQVEWSMLPQRYRYKVPPSRQHQQCGAATATSQGQGWTHTLLTLLPPSHICFLPPPFSQQICSHSHRITVINTHLFLIPFSCF